MAKLVVYSSPSKEHFKPKTAILRSIAGMRRDLLFSMFHSAKVFKKSTKTQLEAYRADWIEWLDRNPINAYLSHHDAFWQYIADCDSGAWERFKSFNALIASQTIEMEAARERRARYSDRQTYGDFESLAASVESERNSVGTLGKVLQQATANG